jgi:hypothetical protein
MKWNFVKNKNFIFSSNFTYVIHIVIIIIVIIVVINCNWVITQLQWLFYMYTNMNKKSN